MSKNGSEDTDSTMTDRLFEWSRREGTALLVVAVIVVGYGALSLIGFVTIVQGLQIAAPILGGVGTFILAALYWRQQEILRKQADNQERQTKIMRNQEQLMSLHHLPQLSIDHEEDKDLLTFQNTSDVPVEGSAHLSMTTMDSTDVDSPILRPSIPYENLPDDIKIDQRGDFTNIDLVLEPNETTAYAFSFIQGELSQRRVTRPDGDYIWFRVDAELKSTLDDKLSRDIQKLFKVGISENRFFSSTSFEQAQKEAVQ